MLGDVFSKTQELALSWRWFKPNLTQGDLFMKKQILSLTLVTAVLAAAHQPAYGGWFSSKKEQEKPVQAAAVVPDQSFINLSVSAETNQTSLDILRDLQAEMQNTFDIIERKIESGQTGEALMTAQNVLDKVRMNIGVDPKAKLTENFFLNTTFPQYAVGLDDLPETQRVLLIKSLRDFKGKLFLDILNLSKRTSFLYAKAFRAELLKRSGALQKEDKQKIIQDLGTAILMPLPVVDRTGNKIVVFGDEIANDNLVYLFNQELKDYFQKQSDLGLSSEKFLEYLGLLKKSLTPIKLKPIDLILKRHELCMVKENQISGRGIHACFQRNLEQVTSFQECTMLVDQYRRISTQIVNYHGSTQFNPYTFAEFQEQCDSKFPLNVKR